MKILDNGVLREMTEEEIELFFTHEDEEATAEDYEAALAEMGVEV